MQNMPQLLQDYPEDTRYLHNIKCIISHNKATLLCYHHHCCQLNRSRSKITSFFTFDQLKIFLSIILVAKSGSCSAGEALAICLSCPRSKRCSKPLKITGLSERSPPLLLPIMSSLCLRFQSGMAGPNASPSTIHSSLKTC